MVKKYSESVSDREILDAALTAMRSQLNYDNAPMLEQMIIQQLLLAWLRLNLYERSLADKDIYGAVPADFLFWSKMVSSAMRRYLRTCETLARVRRLSMKNPALQVNIATESGNQVNFSGDYVKS